MNTTLYDRLKEIFKGSARPQGLGNHRFGKRPRANYRYHLKRKRKEGRDHRKLVRRMRAGRKHVR